MLGAFKTQWAQRRFGVPHDTSLCTGELNAIRKQNSFSAVLFTEGRVVGLCWAHLKSRGPTGPLRNQVVLKDHSLIQKLPRLGLYCRPGRLWALRWSWGRRWRFFICKVQGLFEVKATSNIKVSHRELRCESSGVSIYRPWVPEWCQYLSSVHTRFCGL
jgi:hypothetical protein